LYGGRSGEHEISLASAAAVFAHIDRQRYEPVAIRIEKDGRWVLADRPPSAASAADVIEQMRSEVTRLRAGRDVFFPPHPGDDTLVLVNRRASESGGEAAAALTGLALDVIFPVLHGPYGEDGTIQGLLELAGVPYVGCGVLASSVGMDKAVMKALFRAHGLQVVDWIVVRRGEWQASAAAVGRRVGDLGYPVFVKPANMGSSLGISKVHDPRGLGAAMALALEYDRKVVVERAVPEPREIECAILGNDDPAASVPGEIVSAREFYDYEAKYLDGHSRLIIPAPLDRHVADEVRRLAILAFQTIDGAGLARVDFLLGRATGELFVNEINTLPGFTTISMYSKLWAASDVDTATLIERLIALALERHADKQQPRVTSI
jgi:D-alanine-D-alanine ligase